jgi:gliding motility-associated-like protein
MKIKERMLKCFCFYYLKPIFIAKFFTVIILVSNTTSAQKKYFASNTVSSLMIGDILTGVSSDLFYSSVSSSPFIDSEPIVTDRLRDTFDCTPPTFLNNSFIVLDASCGAADGAITIVPTRGIAPYKYSIDGGITYVNGPNSAYTFMNVARGDYKLRLKDSTGCESAVVERKVRMIYRGPTFLNTVQDEISCVNNNGKIFIKPIRGVPPFMYSLDEGRTYFAGSDTGYVFDSLKADSYFLRVKDAGECESEIVRSVVKYIYYPEARKVTIDAFICPGEKYKLSWGPTVEAPGLYKNFQHYVGVTCDSLVTSVNVVIRPAATDTTVNVSIIDGEKYTFSSGGTANSAGSYIDTIKYRGTNCDSLIKKINLTVRPAAILTTTAASICTGSSYFLPSGAPVSKTGTYHDTLRYTKGYDSLIATINLTVKTSLKNDRTVFICEGENFILPSGKVLKSTGLYYDTLTYISGCDSSITTINLIVKPSPKPTITKSNDITCIVGRSTLLATGGNGYIWQPSPSINNTRANAIVVSPVVSTIYKVRVIALNGCSTEDSIEVKVDKQVLEGGYLLPSAFTPNNDGKNDCFGVSSWPNITNLTFVIYNRWGGVVFKTTDPSTCWDGTYKGKLQGFETFVYQITAKTFCGGQLKRSGTIILIR